MTLAIISSPACDRHDMGDGHPESPLRLGAIRQHLQITMPALLPDYLDAPAASREQLARVHSASHI